MSRAIQRRPTVFALIALLVMLALCAPLFSLRLGNADTGSSPKDYSTRKSYDLLAKGFGPGFNGPLLVVSETPAGAASELPALVSALQKAPNVAFVTPPQANPARDTSVILVFPKTSPQSEETETLIHSLRDDVLPAAVKGTQVEVSVGGLTAGGIDFAETISSRLPLLFTVVLALSFLLLMAVFRSVLVPLKAVVMNLLSIGAAYGVIVAIFQWGWLSGVIDIGRPGPIEPWAPMMLFAILFGLSMDYEVFLLSRIREEYVRTRNNADAVAVGLASTARVITAAAAIMIAIFLSFVFMIPGRQIKLFGLGMAVAIFVDATIVRMILVPATMELLGDANWYLPRWLGRILPKISVEGTHPTAPTSDVIELEAEVAEIEEEEEVIDFGADKPVQPARAATRPALEAPAGNGTWHERLTSVAIGELRTKTTEVVRQAEEGKTLIVTRNGKPVAVVVPFDKMDKARRAADAKRP